MTKVMTAVMTTVRQHRAGLRIGAALVGAAILATGCSGSPSAAGDGGEITVLCGATEEWCEANTSAFTEATGIGANYVRLSSGEAAARLEAGKDAPEFDVWHGGPADGYTAAADRGLLEPYTSPAAAAVRPEYKAADGSWTGIYVGVLGFCSNKTVLAKLGVPAPTSWQELLDPRLAKNVSVAHPSTSGTGFTALWTQVALAGGDQAKGLDYMMSLRPNILQFTRSGVGPLQQVSRGEIATGIVFSHDCVKSQEEGIDDLEVSFPREGTGYEVGGVAVVKNARNPQGAKAYVDWSLSKQAQEIGPTVGSYQLPTNPEAAVSDKSAHLDQLTLVDYDIAKAGAAKSDLVKKFDADISAPPAE
jgi:iron(III) transport system substrate-binding protein